MQLDANGDVSINAADIDGGSMITAELPRSLLMAETRPLTLIVLRLASTRSTLTVTDVSGNISTCDAIVTVTDTVAPTAICQNITVQLDANGDVSINAADIDGGSNDNCGIASVTVDGGNTTTDFDCSQVGINTVTLTVTDVSGNISTCDAIVTVTDTVAPTAICQNITVQLDANGDVSINAADIDGGSNDNCGIASVTVDGGNTTH